MLLLAQRQPPPKLCMYKQRIDKDERQGKRKGPRQSTHPHRRELRSFTSSTCAACQAGLNQNETTHVQLSDQCAAHFPGQTLFWPPIVVCSFSRPVGWGRTAGLPVMGWEDDGAVPYGDVHPCCLTSEAVAIEETGLASNSTSRARGPLGGLEKNVLRIALVNAPH